MWEFNFNLDRLPPLIVVVLFSICIISVPEIMVFAVFQNFNPSIERTLFLIKRWSRSTILLRYFICLGWMPIGSFFHSLTLELLQGK